MLVHRTAPGRYVAYVGRPPAGPAPDDGAGLRLVAGDLTPYAAEVAQTIAAAVAGDDAAHVMLVGRRGRRCRGRRARRPGRSRCRSSSTRSSPRAPRPPRCRGSPTRPGCSRSRTAPTRSPCSARWSAPATTSAPRSSSTRPARRRRVSTSPVPASPTPRPTWSPSSTGCASWATSRRLTDASAPYRRFRARQLVRRIGGVRGCRARTRPSWVRLRHSTIGTTSPYFAGDRVAGVPVPAVLGVEPPGVPGVALHLLELVEREVGVVGAGVAEDQQRRLRAERVGVLLDELGERAAVVGPAPQRGVRGAGGEVGHHVDDVRARA